MIIPTSCHASAHIEFCCIEDGSGNVPYRFEDLQLGVESYQKKLNLTKPRTRDVDLSRRPAYTTLSNPQGVIYEDKLKRKRFMHADELHKFSDDTLISFRDTLDQMLHELHLGQNRRDLPRDIPLDRIEVLSETLSYWFTCPYRMSALMMLRKENGLVAYGNPVKEILRNST
ncbi:hypothetical protein Tco_0154597 [Tanacetum coccineum]